MLGSVLISPTFEIVNVYKSILKFLEKKNRKRQKSIV